MDVLRLYFLASRVIFIQIPNFPNCVLNITLSREIGSEVVEGGWRAVSFPANWCCSKLLFFHPSSCYCCVCVCARVFFPFGAFYDFWLVPKKKSREIFYFSTIHAIHSLLCSYCVMSCMHTLEFGWSSYVYPAQMCTENDKREKSPYFSILARRYDFVRVVRFFQFTPTEWMTDWTMAKLTAKIQSRRLFRRESCAFSGRARGSGLHRIKIITERRKWSIA